MQGGHVLRSLRKCFFRFYGPGDLFSDEFAGACSSDSWEEKLPPSQGTGHGEWNSVLQCLSERGQSVYRRPRSSSIPKITFILYRTV